MTPTVSILLDVALAVYLVRGVWTFTGRYHRLKDDVGRGDASARTTFYRRAVVFEWVSAALALVVLRFDWSALRPQHLDLAGLPVARSLSLASDSGRGTFAGIVAGLVLGTVAFAVSRLRARGAAVRPVARVPRWRTLLPDFTPLLPVTSRERVLWLLVAVSAGVCEELVFRGWLLHVLHGPVGLAGTTLVVAAAVGFGLAHAYQGVAGVVLATTGGILFCALYVATGSLLVPILLHVAVDARFALLPGPARPAPDAIAGLAHARAFGGD